MVKIKVDYIANHKLHTMIIHFPLDNKAEAFRTKLLRRKDVASADIMEAENTNV